MNNIVINTLKQMKTNQQTNKQTNKQTNHSIPYFPGQGVKSLACNSPRKYITLSMLLNRPKKEREIETGQIFIVFGTLQYSLVPTTQTKLYPYCCSLQLTYCTRSRGISSLDWGQWGIARWWSSQFLHMEKDRKENVIHSAQSRLCRE